MSIELREVARLLDRLPEELHDRIVWGYQNRGGRPGDWTSTARSAWAQAMTAEEDMLEEIRGVTAERQRLAIRVVRMGLEESL